MIRRWLAVILALSPAEAKAPEPGLIILCQHGLVFRDSVMGAMATGQNCVLHTSKDSRSAETISVYANDESF